MTKAVLSAMIRPLVEPRLPDWVEPLWFSSKEEALEYAEDHGIEVDVQDPKTRKPNLRAGGYGENFATNRRGPWTH